MISSSSIRKYLESEKYDYKTFKLKYTNSEINSINELNITNLTTFNYYGDLNSLDFEKFFSKVGENSPKTIKSIEKIIRKITKKVLNGFDMDHFWISIRAFTPTNSFDMPRWHYDGTYFTNIKQQAKFAMVLKGPGTLFIKKTKKVSESYNKIQEQSRKYFLDTMKKKGIESSDFKALSEISRESNEKYRPIFAKELSKYKIKQIKSNQGVVFWGGQDPNYCALHSEPKIDQSRLFISILPGTKAMIKESEEKQKQFEKKIK
jgi:hypothetical protein